MKFYRGLLALLALLFFFNLVSSQSFYISYNSFSGGVQEIEKTLDNQLIVFSNHFNSNIHNLVKVDGDGQILWQRELKSPYPANSFGVTQTTDSGFVSLRTSYTGNGMISIVKVDKNGNYLWSKKFNESTTNQGNDIAATEDGGFAVIGGGCSGNNFVVKFDVNGDIVWKNQYRDLSQAGSIAFKIIQGSDHSLIVAGCTSGAVLVPKLYLMSIDANGNTLWNRNYPLPRSTWATGLIETADGGYAVSGYTNTMDSTLNAAFLLRTNGSGGVLWAKGYRHALEVYPKDIVQVGDGGFVLTGIIDYPSGLGQQMLNLKTDTQGNVEWANSAGNFAFSGSGLDQLLSNEWLIGNYFYTGGFADNTILVKNDLSGFNPCVHDTVNFTAVPLPVSVSSPTITLYSLNFMADTALITSGSPNYVRNLMCTPVAMEEDVKGEELRIIPNPIGEVARVEFGRVLDGGTVRIFDIVGKCIKEIEGVSGDGVVLGREGLGSGGYFIRVVDGAGGFVGSGRFLVD
jgi:hypothetical protein